MEPSRKGPKRLGTLVGESQITACSTSVPSQKAPKKGTSQKGFQTNWHASGRVRPALVLWRPVFAPFRVANQGSGLPGSGEPVSSEGVARWPTQAAVGISTSRKAGFALSRGRSARPPGWARRLARAPYSCALPTVVENGPGGGDFCDIGRRRAPFPTVGERPRAGG